MISVGVYTEHCRGDAAASCPIELWAFTHFSLSVCQSQDAHLKRASSVVLIIVQLHPHRE